VLRNAKRFIYAAVSGNRRATTQSKNIKNLIMNKKESEVQQHLKEFLLDKISEPLPTTVKIVEGSIPIVFFGNVEKAEIATLSLNPSNIEFEHNGVRRCVDRKYLKVSDNQKLTREQAESVYHSLLLFFQVNPYKTWFNPMNKLFQSKGYEYYNDKIVHLDISPWATSNKWDSLSREERESIIDTSIIEKVIENQGIKKLFINGKTAFNVFCKTLNLKTNYIQQSTFTYTTKNGNNRSYKIYETEIFGCKVVGWNLYIHQGCPQDLVKKINDYL